MSSENYWKRRRIGVEEIGESERSTVKRSVQDGSEGA